MNSFLIEDISEFFSKFTKFAVVILSGSVDKMIFCISSDRMISESCNWVGEIPSL